MGARWGGYPPWKRPYVLWQHARQTGLLCKQPRDDRAESLSDEPPVGARRNARRPTTGSLLRCARLAVVRCDRGCTRNDGAIVPHARMEAYPVPRLGGQQECTIRHQQPAIASRLPLAGRPPLGEIVPPLQPGRGWRRMR